MNEEKRSHAFLNGTENAEGKHKENGVTLFIHSEKAKLHIIIIIHFFILCEFISLE